MVPSLVSQCCKVFNSLLHKNLLYFTVKTILKYKTGNYQFAHYMIILNVDLYRNFYVLLCI